MSDEEFSKAVMGFRRATTPQEYDAILAGYGIAKV